MKKILLFIPAALICCVLYLNRPLPPRSQTFVAMNTPMTLTFYGRDTDKALTAAHRLIRKIEGDISATDPQSTVYRLNHAGGKPVSLDGNTAFLLNYALKFSRETQGAFDPALYRISSLWGFTSENPHVPSVTELAEALAHSGAACVKLDGNTAVLENGAMADFGALGKGYAGDRVLGFVKKEGIPSALLNLGGNVQMTRPPEGKKCWHIGITAPTGNGLLGIAGVESGAVITSGSYERFFTADNGKKYWHIIDPATGRPADSGLESATVFTASGLDGDALSTALFVMGPEKAAEFWRTRKDFEMILAGKGHMYITQGIREHFTPAPEYKDMEVTVIR